MRIPVADGVTLAADAFGDPADPPVVLLHGGGQTRHAWGNTARLLGAAGWYALTVDLRGHGDSDWSPDGDLQPRALRRRRRGHLRVAAEPAGARRRLARRDGQPAGRRRVATTPVAIGARARRRRPAGRARRRRPHPGVHAPGPRRLPRPRGGGRRHRLLQPAPAATEGPVRADQEPPPARRRPLVLALGPAVHGAPGAAGRRHRRRARRRAWCPRSGWRRRPRNLTVPTLLVRGQASDLLSEEGAAHMLRLVPHARAGRRRRRRAHGRRRPQRPLQRRRDRVPRTSAVRPRARAG